MLLPSQLSIRQPFSTRNGKFNKFKLMCFLQVKPRQTPEYRKSCRISSGVRAFVVFGVNPVPPDTMLVRAPPCLRSYAVGVAAMSRLPCRPAVQPLPAEMQASCRITECFVRIQAMEVKCITIYGVPRCLPDAAAKNNLLLAWAYQRALGFLRSGHSWWRLEYRPLQTASVVCFRF